MCAFTLSSSSTFSANQELFVYYKDIHLNNSLINILYMCSLSFHKETDIKNK